MLFVFMKWYLQFLLVLFKEIKDPRGGEGEGKEKGEGKGEKKRGKKKGGKEKGREKGKEKSKGKGEGYLRIKGNSGEGGKVWRGKRGT